VINLQGLSKISKIKNILENSHPFLLRDDDIRFKQHSLLSLYPREIKRLFKNKNHEIELDGPPSPNSDARNANVTITAHKLFIKKILKKHKLNIEEELEETTYLNDLMKTSGLDICNKDFNIKSYFKCPRSKRRRRRAQFTYRQAPTLTFKITKYQRLKTLPETSDSSMKGGNLSSKNDCINDESLMINSLNSEIMNIESDWIDKDLEINRNNFYDERNFIPSTFRDIFYNLS